MSNNLYRILTSSPADRIGATGLEFRALEAAAIDGRSVAFEQTEGRLRAQPAGLWQSDGLPPVSKPECDRLSAICKTGGMRTPLRLHPWYNPVSPDISR